MANSSFEICLSKIREYCLGDQVKLLNKDHNTELYLALRHAFVMSKGAFNAGLNLEISKVRPSTSLDDYREGLLMKHESIRLLATLHHTGGYAHFYSDTLSEMCGELIDAIDASLPVEKDTKRHFLASKSKLFSTQIVKSLVNDLSIKQVADWYLRCDSILNAVTAWRTSPGEDPSMLGKDAMQFHFDSDHNRFIKVFVYLSDVDASSGPHCFVPQTSASFRKYLPSGFQRDGRFSDESISSAGLEYQKLLGPSGTVIFADTHNLHKGMPVTGKCPRYVLQMQFVDSIFGAQTQFNDKEMKILNPFGSFA